MAIMRKFTMPSRRRFRRAPLLETAAALFVAAPLARAGSRLATLEAIHALENPYDLAAPGPCGELGPYQFREATWRRYSAEPFARALDLKASDAVAVRHYEWIKRGLERHGLKATAYNIALAWNGGLSAAVGGHPPAAACDYAQRAANLAAAFGQTLAVR